MKKHLLWALALAPMVIACSELDPSDIDTTMSVPVNDLIIPINLEKEIQLQNVIELNTDGKVQQGKDGYYIEESGSFISEQVKVDPVVIKAQPIAGISETLTKSHPSAPAAAPSRLAKKGEGGEPVAYYQIPAVQEFVKANSDRIEAAIETLRSMTAETSFHFEFDLDSKQELKKQLKQLRVEDLTVKIPRGIDGDIKITTSKGKTYEGIYDSATGIIKFADKQLLSSDGIFVFDVTVRSFDSALLDAAYNELKNNIKAPTRAAAKDEYNSFVMSESYGINTGGIMVYEEDFVDESGSVEEKYNKLPESLEYVSAAKMDDIKVTKVSGEFRRQVEDINVDGISLGEMPDVLSQSGTDIRLSLPQIYVTIKNPIADGEGKTIAANTRLLLTAFDAKGQMTGKCEMKESIVANKPVCNFCLATGRVEKYLEGYEDAQFIDYSSLADILAGKGIPSTISIQVVDTEIYGENVTDYELGQVHQIEGSYLFYAPLALAENSVINYKDIVKGWSKDTEKIDIKKLSISVVVNSSLPMDLELSIKPIKVDGTEFAGTYSPAKVPAYAKSQTVEMSVEGEFKNLDGISIEATAVSKDGNKALDPEMTINISDLKVKVSGNYVDKF